MKLTVYTANVSGDAKNCLYPNKVEVTDAEGLAKALAYDHTCGEFKGNYRSIGNFLGADVIPMDFDNSDTEDPREWVTPQKIADMFPDVCVAIAPSRNNMKPKDGRAPRPKGHAYFLIPHTSDPDEYAAKKRGIQKACTFFDPNATDAARFMFGTDMEADEILWQDGWLTIDEVIKPDYGEEDETPSTSGVIQKGSRNKTLSRFAIRILKKLGDCDKAKEVFLDEAAKCEEPLDSSELRTIWNSALKFYNKKVSKQDGYVPPDQYNNDFGTGGSLMPPDYSDIGEAKVLASEYGNELRYCDATDFLRYDGDSWCEDKQLSVLAMEELLDLQLADAEEMVEKAKEDLKAAGISDDDISGGAKKLEKVVSDDQKAIMFRFIAAIKYLAFINKRRDFKYVVSAMNASKPMLLVNMKDLDRDGNLLNTPDGTFDLTKGIAGRKEHDPADLITKITECAPSDKGKTIWDAALETFFCGDAELIGYVQEIVGMAAVGKVYQEHLIIAYGDGANGKSTFWNALFRVLGNYAGKLSAEALTMSCKRNVKPEMAELKGKRLIIASEMEEGMRLNTSIVKQLCATDEIYAEKKYKAPFYFTPSHTLVLYTNHLPKVGASDDGIWRRLIVIPFDAKITGTSDIKNYADYLVDNAGEAIMQWIIEGAKRIIDKDFKNDRPQKVLDAISAYRDSNDWMGHFLEDCCDIDASFTEKSGDLYQQYRAYCLQNNEFVRSTTDFYQEIEKRKFFRHRTNKGYLVEGLKLKDGTDFF